MGVVEPRAESHVRLKKAVRRNRAFSREGLLERLFERLFRGLVYTQIWEDPEIDLEALALGPDCHVVAHVWPQARLYGIDISAEMLMRARHVVERARLDAHIDLARADATHFDPAVLFGVPCFSRIIFSYSLSMI